MSGPRLALPDDLEFAQWDLFGTRLQTLTQHVQWWWGDWINFGQSQYGEKYQIAVEKFGLNLKTAQDYAWVAREYQSSDRSELSWTHFKVAAGMRDEAERTELLDLARQERWSVRRLRREIKAATIVDVADGAAHRELGTTSCTPAFTESSEKSSDHETVLISTPRCKSIAAPSVDQPETCHSNSRTEVTVIYPLPLLAETVGPLLTSATIRAGDGDVLKEILAQVSGYCDHHPDDRTVILKHFKKLIAPRKSSRSRTIDSGSQPGKASRSEQSKRVVQREAARFGIQRRVAHASQRLLPWSDVLESQLFPSEIT